MSNPLKMVSDKEFLKVAKTYSALPTVPVSIEKEVGLRLSAGCRWPSMAAISSACNQPIAALAKLGPAQLVAAATGPADVQLFQWVTSLTMLCWDIFA